MLKLSKPHLSSKLFESEKLLHIDSNLFLFSLHFNLNTFITIIAKPFHVVHNTVGTAVIYFLITFRIMFNVRYTCICVRQEWMDLYFPDIGHDKLRLLSPFFTTNQSKQFGNNRKHLFTKLKPRSEISAQRFLCFASQRSPWQFCNPTLAMRNKVPISQSNVSLLKFIALFKLTI